MAVFHVEQEGPGLTAGNSTRELGGIDIGSRDTHPSGFCAQDHSGCAGDEA